MKNHPSEGSSSCSDKATEREGDLVDESNSQEQTNEDEGEADLAEESNSQEHIEEKEEDKEEHNKNDDDDDDTNNQQGKDEKEPKILSDATRIASSSRLAAIKQKQLEALLSSSSTSGRNRQGDEDSSAEPGRLQVIKQQQLEQLLRQSESQHRPSLSNHKEPAGRTASVAAPLATASSRSFHSDAAASPAGVETPVSSFTQPGAFEVRPTAADVETSEDPMDATDDPENLSLPEDDVETARDPTATGDSENLLFTAELVDHEREVAMMVEIERLRAREQEYTRRTAAVVVALDDRNDDYDADSHNDGTNACSNYKRFGTWGLLIMIMTAASLALGLLLPNNATKPRKGTASPTPEQREILSQAGLYNFTFFLDKYDLWNELEREQISSSDITILAFSDTAYKTYLERINSEEYFNWNHRFSNHARRILRHHMFVGTMRDIRGNFSVTNETVAPAMLSGEKVQVQQVSSVKGTELIWSPSVGDVDSSAIAMEPPVLVLEQDGKYLTIYVLASNHVLLPRFLRVTQVDLELFKQTEARLIMEIIESNGILDLFENEMMAYTWFLPNNAAIERIPQRVVQSLLTEPTTQEELSLLLDMIGVHVVASNVLSMMNLNSLTAFMVTSYGGSTLEIWGRSPPIIKNVRDGISTNVVTPDIYVHSGMAHIVDAVLLPESRFESLAGPTD